MTTEMTTEKRPPASPLGPLPPLRRIAEYTGEPGCIAAARAFADGFLQQLAAEWLAVLPARTEQDVRLVVSELVTNADRHSDGPYMLELEGCARWLTVTVYDSNAVGPMLYARDPARVGGHGMEIVHALCHRVTVESVPVGKRIRAEFLLDEGADAS